MKNIFFTLLLCLLSSLINASPIQNNISHIEKVVLEKIKAKNLSSKDTQIIYMLAGREFFNYKMYNKSEEYYLKVLEINSNDNKSEALINLMTISLLAKDQTKASLYLKNAKEYFKLGGIKMTERYFLRFGSTEI
jgi:tetratricopeptide (TPR) repeat protein